MKDIFERFKQYKESVTLFEGEEDKVLHQKSIAIMKMLSHLADTLGVGDHVYVVGGAVRNFVINKPIKDIDLVIDSIALGGRGSDWFADNLIKFVNGTKDNSAVDQYGVAIVSLPSDFDFDGVDLSKEVIEIANARTEKYGGDSGKGYKPSEVIPASIEDDVIRREFTFNCLVGDTLVPTERGLLRIDEIADRRLGDQQIINLKVLGANEPELVVGWQYSGHAPVVEVVSDWGHKIICTHHHPILVLRDLTHVWVQADSLKKGDLLCFQARRLISNSSLALTLSDSAEGAYKDIRKPEKMTPELGYLIGLLVAEGSTTSKRVSFSNSDPAVLSRYSEVFEAIFGFAPSQNLVVSAGTSRVLNGVEFVANSDCYDLYADSKTLVQWLGEMGLYCGGTRRESLSPSHFKVIPWSILQADAETQAAFMAGMIEGDGSIRPDSGRITFCSSSDTLRRQTQALLASHGILSKVKDRFVYLTSVDSSRLWEEIQPWMISKTFNYKNAHYKSRNRYGIPAEPVKNFIVERKLGDSKYSKENTSVHLPNLWEPVRRVKKILYDAVDRGDFKKFLRDFKILSSEKENQLQSLLSRKYQYVEVVSVTDVGTADVYDLSMSDGVIPAFVANGLVVHNTLMWKLSDLQNGPENAEIVDLTGKGLTDLENGVMRTPAAPDKTFSDDPSRLIRAIKFKLRYDFDIDMETLNSIKKNAHKIKNIPNDAVSKILINDVFLVRQDVSTLEYLKEFNLLGPLTELCHENQQFHSTLNNWSNRSADLDFMFAMRDYGFNVGSKVNFLGEKVDMFRSNVKSMTADEADEYLMALKQPGRIIDTLRIKQEFNIKDSETKKLMQMAANIMLKYPEKYNDADFLEDVLRKELK